MFFDTRGSIVENKRLSQITWLRVGGPADFFFMPADTQDLIKFLRKLPEDINIFPIGVGMAGEEEGLAYYSPSINGFTFGASMHNAGSASKADGTTYGVKYSTDAAGGTVSIAWAAASRGNTGAETAGSETGYDTTHIGGSIAVGAATIELAQYNQKENGTTATFNDDYSRNSYGLSYKASDTITLNVHSQSGDNSKVTNYDWEETAYDITYAIAPGLTMTMSYTDYNETAADGTACTGTCDGTATNMAIDLSF